MGNKTSILHILYALFPLNYERYIEPFGGSGAVLLGKKKPDKFEVYNDYNHNLVNLFRCMRDRPMAFIKELGFYPLNSRDDFNAIKNFFRQEKFEDKYLDEELELTKIILPELKDEETIELYIQMKQDCDLRRAVMFLKLLRYSYSSGGKSFACQPFSVVSLFQLIEQVGKRLENTVIENQDFEVLIKHYDRDNAFFYCDPPYYSSEYVYQCGFTWEDHLRLKNTLANSKGKWLVSYNDCEEIRNLYDGYSFFDFTRLHNMKQRINAGEQFPELLISNYDMYERQRNKPLQLSLLDLTIEQQIDLEQILKECIINHENQYATLIKTDILAETIEIPSEISSYKVKKLSCVEEAALVGVSLTGVFENNNVVEEIIISEGVVETYGPAIADCYNLEKITIQSTMTTFDVVRCDNLKEVNIVDGDNITESFSFSDCSGLEEIYLPKRINKISTNAFARCYSLKNVKFSKNVYCIEGLAFQGCTSLTNIDLPDKLSEIGSNAFQWCTSLQTIDIPSNVKSIESWTFDDCKSLEAVNLPEHLIKICDGAFQDCASLERIAIYDKCVRIADNAFNGCDKLTICGIKGSYAEQYANEHNIPFEELDTTYEPTN